MIWGYPHDNGDPNKKAKYIGIQPARLVFASQKLANRPGRIQKWQNWSVSGWLSNSKAIKLNMNVYNNIIYIYYHIISYIILYYILYYLYIYIILYYTILILYYIERYIIYNNWKQRRAAQGLPFSWLRIWTFQDCTQFTDPCILCTSWNFGDSLSIRKSKAFTRYKRFVKFGLSFQKWG